MTRRPYGKNPMIWRKATAQDISQAQARAVANEHTHNYYQHPTMATHHVCACGWVSRREMTPEDLIFSGPNKVKGK